MLKLKIGGVMRGNSNVLKKDAEHRRKKMRSSRIIGILSCLIALGSIVVYALGKLNPWLCIIVIAYGIASSFNSNSFLQDIKVGNPWQRINGFCSIFFYVVVVFLIAYGFATSQIQLQF